MAKTIDFNFGSLNIDFTNKITVSGITQKISKTLKTSQIPKNDDDIQEMARIGSRTISMSGDISGDGYEDLTTNLDVLRAIIANGAQQFTIDNERYLYAQLKDFTEQIVHPTRLINWNASFVAASPIWRSLTLYNDERVPTSTVAYNITNSGTYPARLKVTFTAPGGGVNDDIKIENVTRGETARYRGAFDGYKDVIIDNRVDTSRFVVTNDGESDKENFEGNFLFLSPGTNSIKFTGAANVIVKLEWRYSWY